MSHSDKKKSELIQKTDDLSRRFFFILVASKAKLKKMPRYILLLSLCLCLSFPWNLKAVPDDNPGIKEILEQAEKILDTQPEEALEILTPALHEATRIKDPVLVSRAYYLRGDAYFYLDQLDSTIANYLKAVEIDIAAGKDNTPEHINILGNLGYMYDALDQKLIAMDFCEKALKKARAINLKDEIAGNLANIAQVKTIQGYYEEALALMQEALAIDKVTGDEAIIATDLNTIGRIYESWGIYDKAVDYLEQALTLDIKLGMEDKMALLIS